MSAEIKPGRLDLENRTPLQDVIPLDTPFLVFLDPCDRCNWDCKWCPTGSGEADKHKTPQTMDYLLYKKIINDLCKMPSPIKTLRLYSDGEPLLNAELHKMVKYAKDSGRFGQIDTTTNGTLLTPRRGLQLIQAGLDMLSVSVPHGYDDAYIDMIRNFFIHSRTPRHPSNQWKFGADRCRVHVKIIGDGMTQLDKELFYNDFGDISDRMFIENLAPCWPDFDVGKVGVRGIYGQKIGKEVMVCPYIFYSTKINSDGTVSLCFLDWKHDMIIGDLKKESFKKVWNRDALKMVQKAHLLDLRKTFQFKGCYNCKQLIYGAPDNIDAYAEELLKKI